jgi:hypothetical protein
MPRKTKTKKAIVTKTKTGPIKANHHQKDMRFKVSLVILIGMLTFSLMLLLFSLNNASVSNANAQMSQILPVKNISAVKKANGQTLNDSALDFNLMVPAALGQWSYKTGEVVSLTDNSLSDQYLRIFVPLAAAKSNNFDQQYKNILTIRKFSADEWTDIEKSCQKDKSGICDAAGKKIANRPDAIGDGEVYAYTKPTDCQENILAKCNLADKIIESFKLK